ncbi:hypothetical protein J6590_033065 [Homalodisca vitripennis]|nr:hypothetical protein J6590_033065 [Homalodisca vitripennis]
MGRCSCNKISSITKEPTICCTGRQRKAEMMRMANAAKYNWGGTNSATFKVPYYNNPYTLKKQQYWKAVVPQHHRPFIRIKDFARENNFTRGKFYNRFRDSESVARGSRLDTFGNGLDHSEQLVIHDFNSYTSPLVECATPSRGTAPLNRHRETRSDTHVRQSMRGMSANGKSPCKHRPMKEYYGEGEEERNLEDIKMGQMSPRSEDNKPQVVILPCDKPDLDMPFLDIESKEKFLKSQQSPPRCNMEEVKQLVQMCLNCFPPPSDCDLTNNSDFTTVVYKRRNSKVSEYKICEAVARMDGEQSVFEETSVSLHGGESEEHTKPPEEEEEHNLEHSSIPAQTLSSGHNGFLDK